MKTYEFGKFTVVRKLGQGGMGAVYEALLQGPSGFRKTVALKVISAEDAEIDDLAREATMGGLMQHPNLVDIYEYGDVDGVAYIAMEFVDGPTLSQLIRRGPVSPDALVQLAMQVATGLSHAHGVRVRDESVGLVHRDLKPANILISRFGVVKIADFGIAQASDVASDRVTGTPGYMSPEQWVSDPVDTRSDLWSMGAILYRASLGRKLVRKGSDLFRLRKRLAGGEIRDEVDAVVPGLGDVVTRCLQFDPDARYDRAGELKRALAAVPQVGSPDLGTVLKTVLKNFAASQLVASPSTSDTLTGRADRGSDGLGDDGTEESSFTGRHDNLRDDADSFHGRDAVLSQLRLGFDRGARVMTLQGAGGVGKSRLARVAARRLAEAFSGGVLHIEAEAHLGQAQLIHRLASNLGLARTASAIDVESALAHARSLLLVLDGLDVPAQSVTGLVNGLLSRLPGLRLLVTGRAAAGLAGEVVVRVPPLDPATATALYAARAGKGSAEAIAPLAKALDGNPLALELAAERGRLVPPAKLMALMERDWFGVLSTRRSRSPAHHRSMADCIDHSWSRFSAEARGVAVALASASGALDFDQLDAAVAGRGLATDGLFDAIEALTACSFAQLDDEGRVWLPTLHRRWVAQFGDAHTSDGDAPTVHRTG